MALPITFATLASPQPLADFDTQFAAVAALGAIPCTAVGTNAIALTPFANTPTISSYPDLQPSFVFAAQGTNTAQATLSVSGLAALQTFKWNGLVPTGATDIRAGGVYRATPLQALNGGAGGFILDTIGFGNEVSDIEYVIDNGGNPITTGVKGYLRIPAYFSISAWSLISDIPGSIVIDIFRANNAIPTLSIVGGGGNLPTLTLQQFQSGVLPTGWTSTLLAQRDFIAFNVVSAATLTRVTLILTCIKL